MKTLLHENRLQPLDVNSHSERGCVGSRRWSIIYIEWVLRKICVTISSNGQCRCRSRRLPGGLFWSSKWQHVHQNDVKGCKSRGRLVFFLWGRAKSGRFLWTSELSLMVCDIRNEFNSRLAARAALCKDVYVRVSKSGREARNLFFDRSEWERVRREWKFALRR